MRNRFKVLAVFLSIIMVLGCFSLPAKTAKAASSFAYGADVGWLNQLENSGVTWQDDYGYTKDALQILKDHGIDSIRLRLFVNPPSDFTWTKNDGTTCMLGYSDTAGLLYMAQRANSMGFRIMVDFHYSDHFADPAYQDIPSAWSTHTFTQLKQDVYDHTYSVMSQLAQKGIYPEWVQVGNEINSGMLLPYGQSSNNFAQLAQLLNSGYDAVKAVSSSSKVVTHLANGNNNTTFRWFFDNFITTYGGKTDVIGMSYYPYWLGTDYTESISYLSANLNDMVSRYGKEVMVCEVGGVETEEANSYNVVKATLDAVKAVPNSKGIGVFYWEPEANSSVLPDSYHLGATEVVSGKVLKFTTAIDAFYDSRYGTIEQSQTYKIVNRNSGKAINVKDGSKVDGAVLEQYTYGAWNSQKWIFTLNSDGYYTIKNVGSSKVADITGKSTSDGASCIQWTSNGGYNQQWSIKDAGNGYYTITNRYSGKVLDMNGKSTADGGACIQWTSNGGYNQMWSIVAVE
ncbi:glycosyl hydrolase 53 family protein [Konateibacter massiliensis]|uniref:glycosyl hydrolase 53 family protein n=1 Tax=Konateibacter massiliensis TaxID=2002841 RepID=UPI000C15B841|nr:glycosyl hydrolase 53 family protein [Konateibacter massiliensis]